MFYIFSPQNPHDGGMNHFSQWDKIIDCMIRNTMLFLCLSDYVFVNFKIVRLVCLCLFWLQSLISPKNADCGKRLQNCDTNLYNVDEMTTIWGNIFSKKIHFTALKRDFGKISRRFRPLLFRFDMQDSTGFPARHRFIYATHGLSCSLTEPLNNYC